MVINRFIHKYTSNFKHLPNIIKNIQCKNQIPIIDYANENTKDYENNFKIISEYIEKYPNNTFALKFSSLGLCKNKKRNSLILAKNLIKHAEKNNCFILLDAEQNDIQNIINKWSGQLILEFNQNKPLIYKTYQMYRKDSLDILSNDLKLFKNTYLGIKLVRGAYYSTDKNTGKLYDSKKETDENFNKGIEYFDKKNNPKHHLIVASHNQFSLSLLDNCNHQNISVAHLLGFSDDLSKQLVDKNFKVYKYLPFGNYRDTFPYLLRRLYENYPILLHLNK